MENTISEKIMKLSKIHLQDEYLAQFTSQTPLVDSGLNSLTFIDFVVTIENHFHLEFPDDFLEELAYKNIDDISEVIARMLEKKSLRGTGA